MLGMNYDQIVERISKEAKVSKEEIEAKVKQKLAKLSNLISKEGAAQIVANEYGINLYDLLQKQRDFKINELTPMIKNATVKVKVLNVYDVRSFKTDKREGKVVNLFVGDDTSKIRLTIWDENLIKLVEEDKIKPGDVLKITGAYVKIGLNDYKELHLGSQAAIEINPENLKVEVSEKSSTNTDISFKNINNLEKNESALICGVIVHVFEPRFYEACDKCRKKITNCNCPEKGKTELTPILNFYFDDGTDSIRVVAFKDVAKFVMGVDDEKLKKISEDLSIFESIKKDILGKQLEILGRTNFNEQFDRMEFFGNKISEANPKRMLDLIKK